jgi:hypothetical protein
MNWELPRRKSEFKADMRVSKEQTCNISRPLSLPERQYDRRSAHAVTGVQPEAQAGPGRCPVHANSNAPSSSTCFRSSNALTMWNPTPHPIASSSCTCARRVTRLPAPATSVASDWRALVRSVDTLLKCYRSSIGCVAATRILTRMHEMTWCPNISALVANLSNTQRLENHVFIQICKTLSERDPDLLRPGDRWSPAGVHELAMHLPRLLELARDNSATSENLHCRVRETICTNCMHQTACGYCHHRGSCVLRRHAPAIIQAIRCADHSRSCNSSVDA